MLEHLQEIPVRLYRPSTTAPWGFRLQGGVGTSAPLSIQRVFAGGAADGNLNRGDIMVSIDGQDVSQAPHFVAEDLIKKAGKELLVTVKRASSVHEQHSRETSVTNYPFQMHTGGLEVYEHARNLHEIRQKFSEPTEEDIIKGRVQNNARPGSTSYVPKRPALSQNSRVSVEFGWVPKPRDVPDYQSRYKPQHVQQVLSNEDKYYSLPREPIRHDKYEKPAWLGTLRSSGGPKPWEIQEGITLIGGKQEEHPKHQHVYAPVSSTSFQTEDAIAAIHQPKVQITRYSNKGFSTYEQKPADQGHSDTAQVAHLQYNTPISLYSKENAQEVYRSQTKRFTGADNPASQRTPFDSAHSDVYRMVKEGETKHKSHQQSFHTRQQPTFNSALKNDHGGSQRSGRLEQLIHENDDQMILYDEAHISPNQYHHFRETMGVSEF